MDQRAYWVGFNLVRGIGAIRLQALLDFFGNLETAWNAPANGLREAGLSTKIVENILQVRTSDKVERMWERIQRAGIQILTWEDAGYPRRLKEIDQPPPVLYLKGTYTLEDEWAVAIVGTRRMTVYGRQVAQELAAHLSRNNVTVVSGLARGVDAVAHQAALKAGGRTLAVLGCGVDRMYPPEHRALGEEITGSGGIFSDYAPGTPPDSANFPPRNRIISGLTQATVVVEAGFESGALITATFAAEQGREVFAVPGNIYAPQSRGANRLIQQGARPLLNVTEVLETLHVEQIQAYRQARLNIPGDEIEDRILKVLGDVPLHVDEIGTQAGLPMGQVTSSLAMMELKGMVYQVGSMNYIAARENSLVYRTD